MSTDSYIDLITKILEKIKNHNEDSLEMVSSLIVDTVLDSKSVFIFGCTHAGILTQEAFYRTGGLAIFNPIFSPGLSVNDFPITLTSQMERLQSYGSRIAEQSGMVKGDMLIIHSVSGRNNVPIDLCLTAREMGIRTIAITSLEYSNKIESRHPSGMRLFECCDIVIDNCCPFGDALVRLVTSNIKVGPASTVAGAAIINEIVVRVAKRFEELGMIPPVFSSANIDDGSDYNLNVYSQYKNNIKYVMY